MNFVNKLRNFMNGRYGPDDLYKFLFWFYFFIFATNIFVDSIILNYVEISIVVVMFYRFFSKNIYKRNKENQTYLKLKKKILKPFKNVSRNIKDKDNIYKKCNKCKTTLKLPLPEKRGIKHAKCPTCGKRLTVLALKKLKVEIIRK